jgi:hypothetical protein
VEVQHFMGRRVACTNRNRCCEDSCTSCIREGTAATGLGRAARLRAREQHDGYTHRKRQIIRSARTGGTQGRPGGGARMHGCVHAPRSCTQEASQQPINGVRAPVRALTNARQ